MINILITIPITLSSGRANCTLLGPIVIPYGIDVNKVAKECNLKAKAFDTLDTKVNIEIDTNNRDFRVIVPKPKVTDLIKKLSSNGIIKINTLEKIANTMETVSVRELEGTCKSMHIKVI